MRVAHLMDHVDWKGGVETYVLNLIPALNASGFRQAVVFRTRNADLSLEVRWIPYTPKKVQDTVEELEQFRPDIVHAHNIYSKALLGPLLDRFPVVLTTHGYQLICPAQDFYLERPRQICEQTCSVRCIATSLRKRCMSLHPRYGVKNYQFVRWVGRNAGRMARLICPCTYAAQRHCQAGFPASKVSVLPYFCALAPLAKPRPLPETPTITFLGRIRYYKGFDHFIRILGALPGEVHGRIVGDISGRARVAIDGLSRRYGVDGRLECRQWVSRSAIRGVFNQTTVFVFPSVWPETLGMVGLEALATGVPAVAFDVGGVPEWLIPNVTGLKVAVKDDAAAVQAIKRIIFSAEKLKQLGQNGIELIGRKFSIKRHLSQLISIYRGEG